MNEQEDFIFDVLEGVRAEIEDARVGWSARPQPWKRITILENDGRRIKVEEQTIDIKTRWEHWVGQDGPGSNRIQTEKKIGRPKVVEIDRHDLWEYWRHNGDVYGLRGKM